MTSEQLFNQQIETLISKGYPEIFSTTAFDFRDRLKILKKNLPKGRLHPPDYESGSLPFVIVINHQKILSEQLMKKIQFNNKPGVTKLYPRQAIDFQTTVTIPTGLAYLLIDIDRGRQSLNLTPQAALQQIIGSGRSPLTIDEGIAILTQYPDFLKKNNCFSLLASRYPRDKRVPAIWINGQKQANLGWCWDGNPHTWLGSASCSKRVGT